MNLKELSEKLAEEIEEYLPLGGHQDTFDTAAIIERGVEKWIKGKMEWTKIPPTKEGWYWVVAPMNDGTYRVRTAHVFWECDILYVGCERMCGFLKFGTCQWLGPIPCPALPTESESAGEEK